MNENTDYAEMLLAAADLIVDETGGVYIRGSSAFEKAAENATEVFLFAIPAEEEDYCRAALESHYDLPPRYIDID